MSTPSGLYFGEVVHVRTKPKRHRLRYRVFALSLDVDEIDALAADNRVFSRNAFNLFAFYDKDHGPRDGTPVGEHARACLREAGLNPEGWRIKLLCYPRILGYVFNPLCVYFCEDAYGLPKAVIHEVRNTFGQMHSYVVPVAPETVTWQERNGALADPAPLMCHSVPKGFYVSPFIDMEATYHFRLRPPGEQVSVFIREADPEGTLLTASFVGAYKSFSDRSLWAAFLSYPLMTLKVTAGIHWEALQLWRKGVRLVRRPSPPNDPMSVHGHRSPSSHHPISVRPVPSSPASTDRVSLVAESSGQ